MTLIKGFFCVFALLFLFCNCDSKENNILRIDSNKFLIDSLRKREFQIIFENESRQQHKEKLNENWNLITYGMQEDNFILSQELKKENNKLFIEIEYSLKNEKKYKERIFIKFELISY